ncbi:sulfotransferase domain-containing protein [Desulfobacterales bacterium HSG16]|nr:sulfotransferase domain-containing protein [Desulfobacterales bacterium HSG16]
MIIWLASYPRSGNTLLRTILKHCFDICSYADEPIHYESEFKTNPNLIGHIEMKGQWDDFYEHTKNSQETVFIKTHLPPKDNQPFIYIVRDGRSAVKSYKKFYQDFTPLRGMVDLIIGNDAYGNWSDHYYLWNDREKIRSMSLRFEDIVDIDMKTLLKIANFIGFKGEIRKWVNPRDELKKIEPGFFNKGSQVFEPDGNWSASNEYLFYRLHGELMQKFGYYNSEFIMPESGSVFKGAEPLIDDLIKIIRSLLEKNAELASTCKERLDLIDRLQKICVERLDLIGRLHRTLAAND